MKLLITGVGGPTPRSIANCLKKYCNYANYQFFGVDINPLAIGLYQRELFYKTALVPPANQPDAYWQHIQQIVDDEKIDGAIIQPELEVLAWSQRQQSQKLPCPVLLPDYTVAQLLIDKARLTEVLVKHQLAPVSVSFHRNEVESIDFASTLQFPFWVRSTVGTSGLGSLKVQSFDALLRWVDLNPTVEQFLASQFLPGRNLACKLLYFDGELMRAATAERVEYVMAKVAPSGITGNTSFGRLLNEPQLVDVCERAMRIVFDHCNAVPHGFFTVDLKEDEQGNPLVTEINIRHVAFTQCFAAMGMNLASDSLRLLFGDPSFDRKKRIYEVPEGTAFLRDVDSLPIILNEATLLNYEIKRSGSGKVSLTSLMHILNQVRLTSNRGLLSNIKSNDRLQEDLGMDSLELAELTVRIESEFGVDVFQKGLVRTVGEVLERLGDSGKTGA